MRLNEEQTKYILSIKEIDVTKGLFIKLFAKKKGKKSTYSPQDIFIIRKGDIRNLKLDSIETNIGLYLLNVLIVDDCFDGVMEYWNIPLDMKGFGAFDKLITSYLMDGVITTEQYAKYQTKRAWLEFTPTEVLVPGADCKLFILPPEVERRKAELFKTHKEALKNGDVTVSAEIEKELLALNMRLQKDNPAMRLYETKKPSYGNNYKNMALMVGAVKSNLDGSFSITQNNYFDGFDVEDFEIFADSGITGTYQRGVATQDGGAKTKKISAALESLIIDEDPESDCGTEITRKVYLTKANIESYFYRYVVNRGKLNLITFANHKDYIDKAVQMRDPLYCNCEGKAYCAKCMGLLYHKLGITSVGITIISATETLTNRSMKAKHDGTITTQDINFWEYFED